MVSGWGESVSAFETVREAFDWAGIDALEDIWYVILTGLSPLLILALGSQFRAVAVFSIIGIVLQIVAIVMMNDVLVWGLSISGAFYVPFFIYAAALVSSIVCIQAKKKAEMAMRTTDYHQGRRDGQDGHF